METAPGQGHTSLIDRVKSIILKPKEEWPQIAAEPTTQMDVLKGYVLPLAAIGPVASFIGGQIFGYGGFGISFKPSFTTALGTAILSYILTIVGVFIVAAIANALAPKFDGRQDKVAAFKLVAYGATAAWVAGIFGLIPALGFFSILGLYSIYLFYTGTGPMMAIPEDKRIGFTVVTFLAAFVLNLIVGAIVAAIMGLGSAAASMAGMEPEEDNVTISIPGVGTVDTGKMEEAAERMERVQRGEIQPVDADVLKAMLPESLGAYERTSFSSTRMGNAGAGVRGKYSTGDGYDFDLQLNDMLALSGIAGMAGQMGIEQESEDADGYERIGNVDGQWREERWKGSTERGTYAVLVADRFRVEASGKVKNIETLKAAVAAIDADELEDLADE